MELELWLALAGTAASLTGLVWTRESARKLAFILLALLCGAVVARRITYEREMDKLKDEILLSVAQTVKSADQLYEDVSPQAISRLTFDNALNQAVEAGLVKRETKQFWTPDNVFIRVRVYSKQ